MSANLGWVYVMSSPSIKPVKIGYSSKDPSVDRVQELSASTGVPEPFKVLYKALVVNAEGVEAKVHKALTGARTSDNREFFDVGLEQAVRCIRTHAHIEKEYLYVSQTRDNLKELDQETFNSLSLDQKEEILKVTGTARANLLETFIASNHAAQQEREALTPKIKQIRTAAMNLRSREKLSGLERTKENQAKKAIKTRKKYLAFATYAAIGLLMFFVATYGPEEAGPVFVLLLLGGFVAIVRASNIDPDEGLEPYRASYSREEQEILDMDKLSDDELRDILLISDRSKRSVEIKNKLNANNLGILL